MRSDPSSGNTEVYMRGKEGVSFSQLKLVDTKGKNIDMSGMGWHYVDKNPNGCDGEGKWNSPTNFQIVGSNK